MRHRDTMSERDGEVEIVLPGPFDGPGTIDRYREAPRWSIEQLMASWLSQFQGSRDTRVAYERDLDQYLQWCSDVGLDPLNVGLPEVQIYGEHLARIEGTNRWGRSTGKPLSARTRTRKINAVSSFYGYCARAGAIPYNPARDASRPKYDRWYSPTQSMNAEHARNMLAKSRTLRQRVMDPRALHLALCLMIDLGARVTEVCSLNIDDIGSKDGMRTLTMRAKGSKVRVRPVTAQLGPVLDSWLTSRPEGVDDGALLVDCQGARITRFQVGQLLRRLAKASGVPEADRITPHSCRHAFNEIAKERGAALEDRRLALGHVSSSTTQLYDHQGADLRTDPAHLVSASTFTPLEQEE